MIICGVDLETTGLSPETDQVTEIGAVLWDTELNVPVRFFNKLLKIEGTVPPFIVGLTGITDDLLAKYGEEPDSAWREFFEFCGMADAFCAHNAPFDHGFIIKKIPAMDPSVWIDTSVDIEYPESIQTRKLTHLACEHGFVNPFAHRAVTDVLTMLQIASKYNWNELIEYAKAPKVLMRAMVSYEQNDKARTNGYRFKRPEKIWLKHVPETKVDAEIAKCQGLGFLTKLIG